MSLFHPLQVVGRCIMYFFSIVIGILTYNGITAQNHVPVIQPNQWCASSGNLTPSIYLGAPLLNPCINVSTTLHHRQQHYPLPLCRADAEVCIAKILLFIVHLTSS